MNRNFLKNCFYKHKYSAGQRGIAFLFTYEQWLDIWVASGHLHERGCKKGQYVMARYGDVGPYAVGNVKIILHSENQNEGRGGFGNRNTRGKKLSEQTKLKMSAVHMGKPATRGMTGQRHTDLTKLKMCMIKMAARYAAIFD